MIAHAVAASGNWSVKPDARRAERQAVRESVEASEAQAIFATETVHATWVWTQGVLYLVTGEDDTPQAVAPALARYRQLRVTIVRFSDFTEDNDPYGEHDFGAFDLFGAKLFWKIDYYHPDHDTHAPVPWNIELCRRVLTVMLAEEY